MTFDIELKSLLRAHNIFERYRSVDELLRQYRKIVDSLIRLGYDDYVAEFDNDRSVRNDIEKILESEKLSSYKEWEIFQQKVHEIDNCLKELFIPSRERSRANYWWQKGILKNGYGNYADDIKLMYGFDINTEAGK